MSLLMDALKKAEEAKRQASESQASNPSSSAPPSEALPTRSTPPGPALPDLSLHIDSVDADLAAVSAEAPLKRRHPASATQAAEASRKEATERVERADRIAAQNVFLAKKPPPSRTALWIMIGLGVLLALSIGGYFWWQLQSVSAGSLSRQGTLSNPTANSSYIRDAPAQLPVPAPAVVSANPAQSAPELPSSSIPSAPAPLGVNAERTLPPPRLPANTEPLPGQERDKDNPVRLSRTQPRINKTLEQAYGALHNGQLDEAQNLYEQVVRSDIKNTDALLGLATIAVLKGQSERAQSCYQRVLDSDPNNASAQAGLINLKGQNDEGLSESRLKTALSSQPDSSALLFALGNTYARQARWNEAQQAYFRAYSLEPDNADFIFNLAVSLDHLHQNKLAAQYYQAALSVASASPRISFDINQVKNRLIELAP